MKKIVKAQIFKLFYDCEYIGFGIIGSLLVLIYGWGVERLLGVGDVLISEEIAIGMIAHTFPGVLVFLICLFGYTLAQEFQNRTIHYEKMHGYKIGKILMSRQLVSFLNAIILIVVLMIVELLLALAGGYFDLEFVEDIIRKIGLSFICIWHLSTVIGLYVFGVRNIVTGSIMVLVFQWLVFPRLVGNITLGGATHGFLVNYFCINQFSQIWGGNVTAGFVGQMILSFVLEVGIIYIIIYAYYRRKDWD